MTVSVDKFTVELTDKEGGSVVGALAFALLLKPDDFVSLYWESAKTKIISAFEKSVEEDGD